MADVAYKPLGNPKPSDASYEPIKDISTYDDVGVSFKGFSKTKISEGNYKLNPQTRWTYYWKTGTFSTTTISNDLETPPQGKSLFISSMQLSTSVTAIHEDDYVTLRDYPIVGDSVIIWETGLLRSGKWQFTFNPPLRFDGPNFPGSTPSGTVLVVSCANTMNQMTVNMQGWTE